MKKVIILLALLLSACSPYIQQEKVSQTKTAYAPTSIAIKTVISLTQVAKPTKTPPPAGLQRVNKSTGLYASPDFDAKIIKTLSINTYVIPSYGSKLKCREITEPGLTASICLVKVLSTGETGWVLEKWLTEQK